MINEKKFTTLAPLTATFLYAMNSTGKNNMFSISLDYTGHRKADVYRFINLNGRVYDPRPGRFLSPDPFVQDPGYSQNFNRYSYALNNPLKYTDPSGYSSVFLQSMMDSHAFDGGGFYYRGTYYSYNSETGTFTNSQGGTLNSGYHYDWATGTYRDGNGNVVNFSEVRTNYIMSNSIDITPYKNVIIKMIQNNASIKTGDNGIEFGYIYKDSWSSLGWGVGSKFLAYNRKGKAGGGTRHSLDATFPTVTHVLTEKRLNGPFGYISVNFFIKGIIKGNANYAINYDIKNDFKSITYYAPIGNLTGGLGYGTFGNEFVSFGFNQSNYLLNISIPLKNSSSGGVTFSFDKEISNKIISYSWAISYIFIPEFRVVPKPIPIP